MGAPLLMGTKMCTSASASLLFAALMLIQASAIELQSAKDAHSIPAPDAVVPEVGMEQMADWHLHQGVSKFNIDSWEGVVYFPAPCSEVNVGDYLKLSKKGWHDEIMDVTDVYCFDHARMQKLGFTPPPHDYHPMVAPDLASPLIRATVTRNQFASGSFKPFDSQPQVNNGLWPEGTLVSKYTPSAADLDTADCVQECRHSLIDLVGAMPSPVWISVPCEKGCRARQSSDTANCKADCENDPDQTLVYGLTVPQLIKKYTTGSETLKHSYHIGVGWEVTECRQGCNYFSHR